MLIVAIQRNIIIYILSLERMKVNTIISLVSKITMFRLVAPAFAAGKNVRSTSIATKLFSTTEYETKAQPAPGNPFHYAFPVHSLEEAKEFYGTVLGCEEGRSSDKWQDYSLYGHQIVCHWAGNDYRCIDYYNPVDGDEVPVPHAGVALETVEQFNSLVERLRSHNIKFVIEPHLRFKGEPGEQYTMFFKDPSGNNLEFKAMTNHEKLFAKYNVPSE
ncbi:MAG: extradiol dioxygenase family protein [Bacillariaceae sp.]|jgi:extradiol dioxygenase family protein